MGRGIPATQLSSGIRVELNVPAHTRDGVILRANVYRPEGEGPWPTLLTRTPYGKDDDGQAVWCGLDPVQAASQGFIVIVQDVRGRFASDGEWEPFRFERRDGYDTVEWAATLPGSNGRVGMYSASYCGNTQWLAAADRPPSLAAISPAMTWADPMDGLVARGGAVELGLALRWALENGFDYLSRLGLDPDEYERRAEAVIDDWDRLGEQGYRQLPVHDMDVFRRHGLPDLGALDVFTKPDVAEWARVTGLYEQVAVPSLHTAGWYDIFIQGTLDNYAAMADRGDARLIVGPWAHLTFADPIGEQLYGMRAARDGAPIANAHDWRATQLEWFRQHLAGALRDEPGASVRIFVMGRNAWRDESSWPPARASTESWFLHSGASLTTTAPGPEEPPTEFFYDPADPAPTVGGNGVMWPGYATGPVNQEPVEGRRDVLVFSSPPLEEELEVTGRVRVVLHADSSAPATDWVARLCDVHPDGRSINLADGILRVSQGADDCRRYEIDLWSTSNVFLPGHRIRVHVTSSSFPRWDRNLNTGHQEHRRYEVARQRIHHGADRPSFVELPVIR